MWSSGESAMMHTLPLVYVYSSYSREIFWHCYYYMTQDTAVYSIGTCCRFAVVCTCSGWVILYYCYYYLIYLEIYAALCRRVYIRDNLLNGLNFVCSAEILYFSFEIWNWLAISCDELFLGWIKVLWFQNPFELGNSRKLL